MSCFARRAQKSKVAGEDLKAVKSGRSASNGLVLLPVKWSPSELVSSPKQIRGEGRPIERAHHAFYRRDIRTRMQRSPITVQPKYLTYMLKQAVLLIDPGHKLHGSIYGGETIECTSEL